MRLIDSANVSAFIMPFPLKVEGKIWLLINLVSLKFFKKQNFIRASNLVPETNQELAMGAPQVWIFSLDRPIFQF